MKRIVQIELLYHVRPVSHVLPLWRRYGAALDSLLPHRPRNRAATDSHIPQHILFIRMDIPLHIFFIRVSTLQRILIKRTATLTAISTFA